MSAFDRIDAFAGKCYHVIGNLIGVTIGLFALVIAADLAMRLLGVGNLPGMQEVIEYFLFAGVFLGAPWVLRLAAHVRVDLIASAVTGTRFGVFMERALDLLGLLVCLILVFYGYKAFAEAVEFGAVQRKTYAMPEWVLILIFEVSFILLSIEFAFRIFRANAPEASSEEGGGF